MQIFRFCILCFFHSTLLGATVASDSSYVPEGEEGWTVEVVQDSLAPDPVSEEEEFPSDQQYLSGIPEFPEEWKSVSPSEIIKIAAYREFDESDAPNLHRLALNFARTATSAHIKELIGVYFNPTPPPIHGQLCLLARDVKTPEGLAVLLELVKTTPTSASPDDPLLNSASYSLWSSDDASLIEECMKILLEGPSPSYTALFSAMPKTLSPSILPFLSDIIVKKTRYADNPSAFQLAIWMLGKIQTERSRDMLEVLRKSTDPDIAFSAEDTARHLRASAPGLYSAIGQ